MKKGVSQKNNSFSITHTPRTVFMSFTFLKSIFDVTVFYSRGHCISITQIQIKSDIPL